VQTYHLFKRKEFWHSDGEHVSDEVIRTDVVYVTDVRVIKSCYGAGLALKPPIETLRGNLDGDIAPQAGVMRYPIDFSPAASANECHDFIGAEPVTFSERHTSKSAKFTPSRGRLLLYSEPRGS
jgi:hypothetical protein